MEKQFNFYIPLRRNNILKGAILGFFDLICSYPRLILEVFFRTNMGERAFTPISAITVGAILFYLPFHNPATRGLDWLTTVWIYSSWYVFLAAFGFFSFLRYLEIRRKPGVFDLEKFTLSRGYPHPLFDRLNSLLGVKEFSPRLQSIVLEPLVAFVAGLFLYLFSQGPLAILLIFCAIVYSMSMYWSFWWADQKIMDDLDEMILSRETVESLRNDEPPGKGIDFFSKRPSLAEVRNKLADRIEQTDHSYAR